MTKLYTFGEMKQLLNAKVENINVNNLVRGFSIDSRTLKDGDLFFCIKFYIHLIQSIQIIVFQNIIQLYLQSFLTRLI